MKKRARVNFIDRWVYHHSEKPSYYKMIKCPPQTLIDKLKHPQEARQEQYNRWSKRLKIYSGSYLPEDHLELLQKGWESKAVSDNHHHIYQRKSTKQTVRHDDERIKRDGKVASAHWHWLVWWKPYFGIKTKKRFARAKNSDKIYYNVYGEKVSANRFDHHIEKRGN